MLCYRVSWGTAAFQSPVRLFSHVLLPRHGPELRRPVARVTTSDTLEWHLLPSQTAAATGYTRTESGQITGVLIDEESEIGDNKIILLIM